MNFDEEVICVTFGVGESIMSTLMRRENMVSGEGGAGPSGMAS